MQLPPAATILALAVSENDNAHTVIFGKSSYLSSFKTLHTQTAILSALFPLMFLAIKETDIGYLDTLEWFNLANTALLNLLSVLLAKNVYSFTNNFKYTSLVLVLLTLFVTLPPA